MVHSLRLLWDTEDRPWTKLLLWLCRIRFKEFSKLGVAEMEQWVMVEPGVLVVGGAVVGGGGVEDQEMKMDIFCQMADLGVTYVFLSKLLLIIVINCHL